MKVRLISGLRDPETKLRILDSFKAKPELALAETTDLLYFMQLFKKAGHFSKMRESTGPPNSVKYIKQNNFCEDEQNSLVHGSSGSEMRMFYAEDQFFSRPGKWE